MQHPQDPTWNSWYVAYSGGRLEGEGKKREGGREGKRQRGGRGNEGESDGRRKEWHQFNIGVD